MNECEEDRVHVHMCVCVSFLALMELREEMKKQEPARLGLLRSAENLIGQMSGPNADKVTEKAEEVKEKWEELNVAIETKNKGRRMCYHM